MKKLVLVMLIACSLILSLSAGGQQGTGGQSLAGEVTFWQAYPAVNEVYTGYAQEYMEEHPESKIILSLFTARAFDDKLNTAMPAGTAGDILEGWDGQLWAYISAGLLAEPPDYMLDYYRKTTMKFLQREGDIYGMPTFVGLKFLFARSVEHGPFQSVRVNGSKPRQCATGYNSSNQQTNKYLLDGKISYRSGDRYVFKDFGAGFPDKTHDRRGNQPFNYPDSQMNRLH